jgi:choline dehydrogenase-like flavoprotein
MSAYGVSVIGSGAGGGTLVHRFAPSGRRILLLERELASVEPAPPPAQAVR